MAKFTSYHLRHGQIFYAKTGKAVPEKHASKLTVDLAKKTVYKDGRKVGTLRQKTLGKRATASIERNMKRRPRVPSVDMDAARKWVQGKPKGLGSGVVTKLDRETQGMVNFGRAVRGLVQLGRMTMAEANAMIEVYKVSGSATRTALWDEVHAMYDEYGYVYKTAGWD